MCENRFDPPALNPAKSNSLGRRPARFPRVPSHNITTCPLAMFAQNKDCRLQQARMWSEWKELRARETLASHAVLLRAHAAHPPLQPQPRRRSSGVATAFLSSCVASTAFRRNALHKSTPAVHQWLPPFGVTNKLTCGQRCTQQTVHGFFFWWSSGASWLSPLVLSVKYARSQCDSPGSGFP